MRELIEKLRNCDSWYGCHSSAANICGNAQITAMCKDAADAIEKLQSMNNELEYALAGVMHSVDKWLEADDFDHDEVQRAAIMREKVLRIVERLQAKLKQTKRERDAAVADINCGCICVVCKHEKGCKMAQNPLCDEEEPCHFEWRSVQEESK